MTLPKSRLIPRAGAGRQTACVRVAFPDRGISRVSVENLPRFKNALRFTWVLVTFYAVPLVLGGAEPDAADIPRAILRPSRGVFQA